MKVYKDSDFTYPLELKCPPMVKTNQLPMDIIGPYAIFIKKHLSLVKNATTTEEHEKLVKSMAEKDRGIVTEIYKVMRENGYIVRGLDSFGRICVDIMLDTYHSDFKKLDAPPKKLTKEIIKDFNRKINLMLGR